MFGTSGRLQKVPPQRARRRGANASLLEDLLLDPSLDVAPRFELGCTGVDRRHASLEFSGLRCLHIRIGGAVQAGNQFGRKLGSLPGFQSQSVGQDRLNALGHIVILRFRLPSNKRLS